MKTNAVRMVEKSGILCKLHEWNAVNGLDAVSVAAYINKSTAQVFKTLVTESATAQHGFNYFVFVIPADKELNVKKAALAAGVKNIEMLPLKKLLPLTGYVHGGCSPLGMKKNFPVFIDSSAVALPTFCISGGRIGLTLELNARELAGVIGAKFADLII